MYIVLHIEKVSLVALLFIHHSIQTKYQNIALATRLESRGALSKISIVKYKNVSQSITLTSPRNGNNLEMLKYVRKMFKLVQKYSRESVVKQKNVQQCCKEFNHVQKDKNI